MHTIASSVRDTVYRDLERAVLQLADAVDDEAAIAAALRGFAMTLPQARDRPHAPLPAPPPCDVKTVLYRALDEGALDARRFDWVMLAEARARRRTRRLKARARRAAVEGRLAR